MPKLIKLFLSNKKLFLFLLITYNVHLFAIITGSNFNFKLTQETKIKIKLLNKKEYLEKGKQKHLQEYLDKYKDQYPIENTNICKDNIIFSSKTEIIDFLKNNWNLKLSLDDLNKNELDDLNKNEYIVNYYNKKYNSENLSYIYFVKKNDILEKVLLFWNIDKIKEAGINIGTEDLKNITSLEEFLYKNKLSRKNSIQIDKNKPLYYENKKIDFIYFDVQNYEIETLLKNLSNNQRNYILQRAFSNIGEFYKMRESNNQNQNKSQNKIFFFYDTACN
jgi:hypothetical protein